MVYYLTKSKRTKPLALCWSQQGVWRKHVGPRGRCEIFKKKKWKRDEPESQGLIAGQCRRRQGCMPLTDDPASALPLTTQVPAIGTFTH